MAKKIFTYRGKTLEELQELTEKELAALFPARQRRVLLHGLSDAKKNLWKKIEKKDNVETHLRDMLVMPSMIGKTVKVYNGKEYVPVTLEGDMLGSYFGELVLTRKRVMHSAPGVGATRSSAHMSVK